MSGDYQLEDTVYLPFTTRALTGIPTVLVSGVVEIYEDASLTQITTAETLTVSLDSVVGFNMCSVVATTANGFGTGQSYTAILSAGTVNSVSVVGEVIGQFTIEMSAAAKDLANGTDGLGAIKGDSAAILTDTGTTLPASIATVDSNVDAILVDTAEIGAAGAGLTAINLPDQTMNITGNVTGNVSGSVGSVTGAVGSVTGAVGSVTGHTAQTGDTYALANGATGFAAIDTVVDAVLVDTGTTIPGLIGTPAADLAADIAAIAADQKPKVNTALNNIAIYLVSSTDHVTPVTGASPTVTISQDGGAFGAIDGSSSITEVGSGWYKLNLAAADMNAAVVYINVAATGADALGLTISTVD